MSLKDHSDESIRAFGFLIAAAINSALAERAWLDVSGSPAVPECCISCCGSCWALSWHRDNMPIAADEAIRSLGNNYSWQRDDGSIDWSKLEAVWAHPSCCCECSTCHTSPREVLS